MSRAGSDVTVTTWADGFGRWHVRVSSEIGWGNAGERDISRHWAQIRQRARRAVRREILAREAGPIAPVRLEVEGTNDPSGTGVVSSVIFREAVDA